MKHTHVYLCRASCGCVVRWIVDESDYPKDTARSVAESIRDGLTVERMMIEESRKLPMGHHCKKAEAKR